MRVPIQYNIVWGTCFFLILYSPPLSKQNFGIFFNLTGRLYNTTECHNKTNKSDVELFYCTLASPSHIIDVVFFILLYSNDIKCSIFFSPYTLINNNSI